jgi:hypothetical protein
MPELINTLKAVNKRDYENKKFQASLKGIDIGEQQDDKKGGPSFEDIQLRAAGVNAASNDVISLQGRFAAQAGFGVGEGLGYSRE